MTRSVSIYRSLLVNLLLMIVLLSGAILALTFLGSQQTMRQLSRLLLKQALDRVELRLQYFFDSVRRDLGLMRSWGEAGLLDMAQPQALNRLFEPLMRQSPSLSALLVADDRGHEHILFHLDQTWRSRQTRRDTWGARTRWLAWQDGQAEPVPSWTDLDYDPRTRPWYQGAVRAGSATPPIYWTRPYTFYTAQAPGLTASVTFDAGDGLNHVVAIDVLLSDISNFTTSLRVGEHGEVIVLTEQNRVIGLPHAKSYQHEATRQAALLKPLDALGLSVLSDATRAFAGRMEAHQGPSRFFSNGMPWWGDTQPFRLTADRKLSIVVVVPEADLLPGLKRLRLGILLITVGVLVVASLRMTVLARRYSRPIETLVQESERIRRGDLEPGLTVLSNVTEVRQLAEAHERMRLSLQTLVKLESDLQLAQRIQQDTLPERLPSLPGFEIEAWNEAAEETGGDTYDVIGYYCLVGDPMPQLSDTEAEQAILLLADATGHGIGPALSVTQVRAMLRMAVRIGADLSTIICHLNAQLCADLSDGRFITAWLGELNAPQRTLTSFSCGQGPLIYYDAGRQTCDLLETDSFPLGVFDDLRVDLPAPRRMGAGDIFVAISDGIFEAMDPQGNEFGIERVVDLITRQHHSAAAQLLHAIRQAVATFVRGVPAADDCTVLIIKCTAD